MFHFKQFSVDQQGCAMKINTDGVLLGALASADHPESILDIGTGTGVIALMLAQRFAKATVDAVEIDETAALTAVDNFKSSPFANRLKVYPVSFEVYFEQYPAREYDLIVSNPPFYINSLKSPGAEKAVAKHTDITFFEKMINSIFNHLNETGSACLVLPNDVATSVKKLLSKHALYLQGLVKVYSFAADQHHREILTFGKTEATLKEQRIVIYDGLKVYSTTYQTLLRDFLTIF